jgi:3-dehydroquinate dehydratase-2
MPRAGCGTETGTAVPSEQPGVRNHRLDPRGARTGGIVINPAAFTPTSLAILDALNAFDPPVIEVHISNVHKREEFRHHSCVSSRADGVIVGFGTQGYLLALRRVGRLIDDKAQ